MDIPRPKKTKVWRRLAYAVVLLGGIAGISLGLRFMEPAAPTVERASVWTDTVKRGPMVREVRGAGQLLPEQIWWIPAPSEGRVERVLALPGAAVTAGSILAELSNPQLEREVADAEWEVKSLEAERALAEVQVQNRRLDLEATLAAAEANLAEARMRSEVNEELAKDGLVARLELRVRRVRAEELAKLLEIERQRLDRLSESARAELEARDARLAQARALLDLRKTQLEALRVRAGIDGVLEQMDVEVGQRVTEGASIAKVSNPTRLKATIQIPQAQAAEVVAGQTATVDTRSGIVSGHVVRINPAVEGGLVAVDVALDGALPRGARPRAAVDGTLLIERLEDVVSMGRPVLANTGATSLFRLEADGVTAVRVPVQLGRTSVSAVEVLSGLKEGDVVILSDMQQWDGIDRIRLQ